MANTYTSNYRFRKPTTGDENWDDEWFHNQEAKDMLLRNLQLDGNSVIAGLVVTHTSGLGITWTGGAVYVDNTFYSVVAGSTTLSASPSANYLTPTYIYVNSSGAVTSTQSMVKAEMSLIAIVDVSNVAVVAVSDARKMQDTTLTAKPPTGVELTGNVTGLNISNTTGFANFRIDVSAGSCLDSTGTYQMVLGTSITKAVFTAWSVGTGAGGLLDRSVSAIVANTLYNVYLIWKDEDGSVDVGVVASARDVDDYYPTGYSAHRWIGFFVTDATPYVEQFKMNNNYIIFNSDIVIYSGTINSTYTLLDLSGYLPENHILSVRFNYGAALYAYYLSLDGSKDDYYLPVVEIGLTADYRLPYIPVNVDSSIYAKLGTTTSTTLEMMAAEIIR
jgi:hypothetical protein